MKNEAKTVNFEDIKIGEMFSKNNINYQKTGNKTALVKDYKNINFKCEFNLNEKVDSVAYYTEVVISKMETVKSDMVSRQEVIDGINELLGSPFAHSQYGIANKEHAYKIRKEMAEVIINLCLKERKVKSEIN